MNSNKGDKMKRNWMKMMVASMIGALLLIPAGIQAKAKPITLNFNKLGPAVHKGSQIPAEYLAREVEKRTNGRVKIVIFPGSTLASPQETFDAVVKGVCDVGESVSGYTRGRFPVGEALELPLGYPSAWVEAHVFQDFMNHFKPKEFDEVIPLYFSGPPPAVLGTARKQVRTLDDLRGLTIRAFGGASRLITALGGIPRAMPLPDAYEAMSKGIVEGIVTPMEVYKPYKISEVIKYVVDIRCVAYGALSWTVVNKKAWSRISPEDQKTMLQVGYDTLEMRGKLHNEVDEQGIKDFLALPGRKFISLSPEEEKKFRAAAQIVIDNYIKEKKKMGLKPAEYVKYARERIAYWNKKKPQ
jgi:TRAP-type transport system periplasmic protein